MWVKRTRARAQFYSHYVGALIFPQFGFGAFLCTYIHTYIICTSLFVIQLAGRRIQWGNSAVAAVLYRTFDRIELHSAINYQPQHRTETIQASATQQQQPITKTLKMQKIETELRIFMLACWRWRCQTVAEQIGDNGNERICKITVLIGFTLTGNRKII